MLLRKQIKGIIKKAAKEFGMSEVVAYTVYYNYWKWLKDTTDGMPKLDELSEEEVNKLNLNFNIPAIGKLTTNYTTIHKVVKSVDKRHGRNQDKEVEATV